jgi:7-carboxy-7-deazaguanine synthase
MKNNILELYPAIQSEGSRCGRPTIIVRTSGCTHRCYFGEGGWCDSWQTSIHPEKPIYNINDVYEMYNKYNWINEMMITGGSPTMHPLLLNELTDFAFEKKIFTTIETEGSHFVKTNKPIDLVSISPKFSNSIPKLGIKTPANVDVDERMINQHNKFRLNYEAIANMIEYHNDFHYKPVWDGTEFNLNEIEDFRIKMNIPKSKTWLMPAGDNRLGLIETYGKTMNTCIDMGYNFSGRDHIIAFDKERYV